MWYTGHDGTEPQEERGRGCVGTWTLLRPDRAPRESDAEQLNVRKPPGKGAVPRQRLPSAIPAACFMRGCRYPICRYTVYRRADPPQPRLPRASYAAGRIPAPGCSPTHPENEVTPLIYLLEDDDSIRELVIYTLTSQGMEASGFSRPSEFWEAMRSAPPSLLLLDIMLPEEDGIHILKRLRSSPSTRCV